MESIVKELFAATQATDAALDQLQKTAQEIRDRSAAAKSEITDTIALLPEVVGNADILGMIETLALNTVWCVTWAVGFAFYMGRAAVKAWSTRNYATITAEVCATPDADLDELVLPVPSMVAADVDIVELGTDAEELTALSAHQLRPLCQWRNVRGQGKHLAKSEMIAALTC